MRARLAEANVLYVAGFRDGSIKVGTSNAQRCQTRLIEQGAWRANIVATASNGFVVREVEDLVTSELGIAQSVSARRKLNGLLNPVSNDVLAARVAEAAQRVSELVIKFGSDEIAAEPAEWSTPELDNPIWDRVSAYPAALGSGVHSIEVRAVSGRLAALTRPGIDDVFVADLGTLIGVELTATDAEPDPLTIQSSLF